MKNWSNPIRLVPLFVIALFFLAALTYYCCKGTLSIPAAQHFDLSLKQYGDEHVKSIKGVLEHRIHVQPFNLISTFLFGCAILHTFFAPQFTALSRVLKNRNLRKKKEPVDSFGVEFLRFLGEIEVVFGLWVIPLCLFMGFFYNWETTIHFIEKIDFTEAMFVVVIMAIASTNPIIGLAESLMKFLANRGNGSVKAWWWTILTIGPLAGAVITEPAAMTISALLLAKRFYDLKPNRKFAYATLGLLFTNVSVGGVLTNFAAPPVLMVSKTWHWESLYMMQHFGWKAVFGIVLANLSYYLIFKTEFDEMEKKRQDLMNQQGEKKKRECPIWISMIHVLFLAWIVLHSHYPAIFVGSFLLFLGFYKATQPYQKPLELKSPILVGFFLGGLVIHGTLQAWWIAPLLGNASQEALIVMSTVLTSFNDNAEITFLSTLIPTFTESMKYAVVAGAVTGGGLTVIANAPNPSGQAILGKYFSQGISPIHLLTSALFPTLLMGLCFYLFRQF